MLAPLLAVKLRRMILLRLLIVALFLTAGAILFKIPSLVYYGVLCLFLLMSVVYALWTATQRALILLAYFQFTIDLLAVSIFVYYTGNVDSVLATLYVLVIMGASFLMIPRGPVTVAILSSVFYAAVVVLGTFGLLNVFLPAGEQTFPMSHDWWYVGYMLNVRIVIFLLIGYLAGRMVRTIGQMEKQAALSRNFSLLGEMVTHLAHEIKNPLMSISGNIELLGEELGGKLSGEAQCVMGAVVQESQRLKSLLEEVLAYVKPEYFEVEMADLKSILDEVFLLIEPGLRNENKIVLELTYRNEPSALVLAERNRMKQVFMNIVMNAVEAMPDGGVLQVSVRKKRNQVRVSFRDSGVGMSRSQLKELFIPFKTSKTQGTGMGLAIAQKIVCAHAGRIDVRSEPQRGTTVMISLPRA